MPVAYLGAATANASALGVITRPASVVDKSLMVVSVQGPSGGTLVTAPSGWTLVGEYAGPRHIAVWTRFVEVASSETATYTFSVAQRVAMMVFSGVTPNASGAFSSFEIAHQSTTPSAFTNTLSSQTAVIGGQLLAGGMTVRTTVGAVTPIALPTGWTLKASIAGSSGIYAGTLAAPAIGGTTGTQTFTGNDSDNSPGWVTAWMGLLTPVWVSAPLATATAASISPAARGGARKTAATSLATSAELAPSVLGKAVAKASTALSSSQMRAPVAAGAALLAAAMASATATGLTPATTGAALLAAAMASATATANEPLVRLSVLPPTMAATGELAAPSVAAGAAVSSALMTATATARDPMLGQSVVASLMSATMMAHGSKALGGALVSPDVSAVIASIHTPLTQLFYPVPLMSMSASAFGATAFVSAVTTTLLGVATASAVAPKAGVLRTTSAWRGNRMSVNGRVNTGSVTTRPSSSAQVTRNTNDASSTLRAGVTVSPSSPNGVTATQQERDE